jgi:hypothetical protein
MAERDGRRDGHAEREMLQNEDIQLSFQAGETFLLARMMITRIA